MRKNFFLIVGLCFYYCAVSAQDADSVAFVRARWERKKIAPKTSVVHFHFNGKSLFAANQNITYIESANNGKRTVLELAAEPQLLKPTSEFGRSAGAIAAINGTFFDVKNGGSVDFIKINGAVLHENRLDGGKQRPAHQQAAILMRDGKLGLRKWNGNADWEQQLNEENIMVTGPLLVLERNAGPLDSGAFSVTRHPRTAIGLKPDGKVILLTVDGRNEQSAGMSLFELRKIMNWLGCSSSINLDGGGSSTLWVSGYPDSGVLNYPTDNKLWDHAGERKIANVILLKTKHNRESGTRKND